MILHVGGVYGDKEAAIRRFAENYGKLSERIKKHLVMSRSYADYSAIRTLFRSDPDALTFYEAIDRSLEREPTVESLRNAFQHVWGYFKDRADAKEKACFFKKLDKLSDDRKTANAVGRELLALAEKYREEYLLESYFLSEYRK